MVDLQVVCCMCGDVGFPDKLFRCSKCRSRFQHSYCSSYYGEASEPIGQCDWCQSEQRSVRSHGGPSRRSGAANVSTGVPKSEYSGDQIIKQRDREDSATPAAAAAAADKGKNPSPRTATRRYKLLKDVMC